MRYVVTALIVAAPMLAAGSAFADKPPSIDHPRCVANGNAKIHAPEAVALGPLDAVALKLGCPVG